MTLGSLLLFGHITVMIAAVVISYGPSLLFQLAARSGEVANVRGLAVATQLGIWIPILYVVGGLLGLATAINFSYNLLAPWLVIAYVLWVIAMVNGAVIHGPYFERVTAMAATTPDGPLTGEFAVLVADRRERIAAAVDYVAIVAVLFDMVVKPFS
jgi:hypothetical protein